MKTVQLKRNEHGDWKYLNAEQELKKPLVLVFGNRKVLESISIYQEVKALFKDGHIVIGSSCGHVANGVIEDLQVVVTAIEFEKSNFLVHTTNILQNNKDSYLAGKQLVTNFKKEGLKYLLILSEGSYINGSSLTKGIEESLENNQTIITGGLFGDSDRFEKTICAYNQEPKEGEIVAVGFYGDSLEISFSSSGGWTPFGPQRTVTKSDANILYELDDKPALDLYKNYLGEKSKELPGSALLYPLDVKAKGQEQSIVRTVIGIDEEKNAMILAGDVPKDATVHLMMSNVDHIVNASEKAIEAATKKRNTKPELIFFVSCIGRKFVLDQRVEEEVESVVEFLDDKPDVFGFYSYGEIGPFNEDFSCKLHNQTVTLTLISE